jgi:hypothetical protein
MPYDALTIPATYPGETLMTELIRCIALLPALSAMRLKPLEALR